MRWFSKCLFFLTSCGHHQRPSNILNRYRPALFSLIAISLLVNHNGVTATMTKQRKLELKQLIRKTWDHGFDNYMEHAYPLDEIRPISCQGLGPDHANPDNHDMNDSMGNFSLTLIDALDTFVVFHDPANFSKAIRNVISAVPTFDLDSRVQVFETTIRVLGGLLSGHLFASDPDNTWGHRLDWYNDELLHLAEDLANRMMPAFTASRTGIPYARVNLRFGVAKGETKETCTAGAGSLLLEFATLSRLTDNPVYERAARKALYALWNRRSGIDLFGNTINLHSGSWSYGVSSIGAGIDSFYEYLLKSYVLLQDEAYLKLWNAAYNSVMMHVRSSDGFWYRGVNMQTGSLASNTIDSLGAFFPGLQILCGDIEAAIQSHMVYANLWNRYSGMPEVFDTSRREATVLGYPLRPEFAESNYFLYQATKDEYYLEMAERVLHDLVDRTWVKCGLAGIRDVETGALEDRMNSFVLSETLKYLYLTFDEDNQINRRDDPFVFSTEGHILFLPNSRDLPQNQRSRMSRPYTSTDTDFDEPLSTPNDHSLRDLPKPDLPKPKIRSPNTCSHFRPSTTDAKYTSGLKLSVRGRTDFEVAKMLTGNDMWPLVTNGSTQWAGYGTSEVPPMDETLVELVFAQHDDMVDLFPTPAKVDFSDPGAIIKNISGLSFSIKKASFDGTFEVVQIGKVKLKKGSKVMITDPEAIRAFRDRKDTMPPIDQRHLAGLRLSLDRALAVGSSSATSSETGWKIERPAMRANFGPDVLEANSTRFAIHTKPVQLVTLEDSNRDGCQMIEERGALERKVVMVIRGGCRFTDKVAHAAKAGAMGVIVMNKDEELLIANADTIPARKHSIPVSWAVDPSWKAPTSTSTEEAEQQMIDQLEENDRWASSIPLLFVSQSTGNLIQSALDWLDGVGLSNPKEQAERKLMGPVKVEVIETPKEYRPAQDLTKDEDRIVVNGYPLANVFLQGR